MKGTFISIGWGTAIVSVVAVQWYRLVLSGIQSRAADKITEEADADACVETREDSVSPEVERRNT